MEKVVVIGGGFAGLSAGAYLAEKGIQVQIIEASPHLGGRACSYEFSGFKGKIDNGQHIMMGCYRETLKFLALIGADDKLFRQRNLSIKYVHRGGTESHLCASGKHYPFNLIAAILKFSALSKKDRYRLLFFLIRLYSRSVRFHPDSTADEILRKYGQIGDIKKIFWNPVIKSAMNAPLENVSADIFVKVICEIFFSEKDASKIIIPETSLNKLYCDPSEKYIENRGGTVSLSERVLEFKIDNKIIRSIKTNKRILSDFTHVLSTVPLYALDKISGCMLQMSNSKFNYSPILNVYFFVNENIFVERFYGLIDSKIDWIFNKGDHFSVTVSSAIDLIGLPNEEIKKTILSEIEDYFPKFDRETVSHIKIIKEKRATFQPTPESDKMRKQIKSHYPNLTIAGDWTNTGLPSTIESAVVSGRAAANEIIACDI